MPGHGFDMGLDRHGIKLGQGFSACAHSQSGTDFASRAQVTALDIFVFLLLIGGAAVGFVRGFVHEVISLFAWVVAIAMLKLFHTQLWTG